MADNVRLSAGTADGATIATDDDGTQHHQYVKLEFGADNTYTKVADAAPLPIKITDGTDVALVSAGGALLVDASATTQPVSGTVTANLSATDNTVLDNIDADTSAIQTSVELIDDAIKADDAAFTPATTKVMMAGFEYDDTLPDSVDEGDAGAARMSANRNQYVQIRDNAGNERGLNIDANGEIQISGTRNAVAVTNAGITTIAGAVSGTEMQVDVLTMPTVTVDAHAVTNAGTFVVQENGAALTALQLIDDVVYTDDTSTHATGTSKGVLFMAAATPTDGSVNANDIAAVGMTVDRKLHVAVMDALPAGTAAIGKLAANSGVDIGDVDVLSIAAGTNSIGNVGLVPRTSGGMTIFKSIDIDETEEEVKATAGQVFSISAFNHTAAPLFLKFYNLTAANTTVGTSTPVLTFTVPGNADSDGAGFVWNNTIGFAFSTAISVACTTAIADADTGAPAANACSVMIGYA